MTARPPTGWMENHTDDVVLADLILSTRQPVSSELGPLAGRLTMDFSEAVASIPLTVRLAVACMFLAGAHIRGRKAGHMAPLTYALRLWQSLATIPVRGKRREHRASSRLGPLQRLPVRRTDAPKPRQR